MTAPRALFRRAAIADLDRAYRWYEGEAAGLGEELLAAVQEAVRAAAGPEHYPVVRGDVRRVVVRRFSYAVFYRMRGERVVVIAVVHHRRNPQAWQRPVTVSTGQNRSGCRSCNPSVTREHAIAVLELAKQALISLAA